MATQVFIPPPERTAQKQKRSILSQGLEVVGGVVGGVAGGIAGGAGTFGAGAVLGGTTGAAGGMALGRTLGDSIAPPRIVGGELKGPSTPAVSASSAMERRYEVKTKDPLSTLQEAQAALAFRSPEEQKEYGPALTNAIELAYKKRNAGGQIA